MQAPASEVDSVSALLLESGTIDPLALMLQSAPAPAESMHTAHSASCDIAAHVQRAIGARVSRYMTAVRTRNKKRGVTLERIERRARACVEKHIKARLIRLWFAKLWERPADAQGARAAREVSRTSLRESLNLVLTCMGFSHTLARKNSLWANLVLRSVLKLSDGDCRSSGALLLIDKRSTHAYTAFWQSVQQWLERYEAKHKLFSLAPNQKCASAPLPTSQPTLCSVRA